MNIQTVSNQNFGGKFIYDRSLSAYHIGIILKSADKKILGKKNYNLRFWHMSEISDKIFITAENDTRSKEYTLITDKNKIKNDIPRIMKIYERKFSFFNELIRNICNLFIKGNKK